MSVTRVVITGLGVVSPLGVGVDFNWQRLLNNYSGVVPLNKEEYAGIPCQVAARVPISSENEDGGVCFAPELWLEIKNNVLDVHYAHG